MTSILASVRLAAETNSAMNTVPRRDDSPVLFIELYSSKNMAFSTIPEIIAIICGQNWLFTMTSFSSESILFVHL